MEQVSSNRSEETKITQ